MKKINLKDFYASLYSRDCFCNVPDEVAELLILLKRREEFYRRQIFKNKAFYSLDRDDGIENEVIHFAPSAEAAYMRGIELSRLYAALQGLTDKQLRRLYAHFFLNMSYAQIARREVIDESTVRRSINGALVKLSKIIDFFV